VQRQNTGAERSIGLRGLPIHNDALDRPPCFVSAVRLSLRPAHTDSRMPGFHQTRCQPGADVSRAANDDDAHAAIYRSFQCTIGKPATGAWK
jgi:hypothetical protein